VYGTSYVLILSAWGLNHNPGALLFMILVGDRTRIVYKSDHIKSSKISEAPTQCMVPYKGTWNLAYIFEESRFDTVLDIYLNSGSHCFIGPGASILCDGEPVEVENVHPGQEVDAVLSQYVSGGGIGDWDTGFIIGTILSYADIKEEEAMVFIADAYTRKVFIDLVSRCIPGCSVLEVPPHVQLRGEWRGLIKLTENWEELSIECLRGVVRGIIYKRSSYLINPDAVSLAEAIAFSIGMFINIVDLDPKNAKLPDELEMPVKACVVYRDPETVHRRYHIVKKVTLCEGKVYRIECPGVTLPNGVCLVNRKEMGACLNG
jgi:hypothetical protein